MNDVVLLYFDRITGRCARATAYKQNICPADMEELIWVVTEANDIPGSIFENNKLYLLKFDPVERFKLSSGELSTEEIARLDKLSEKADCLERLSRTINYLRFLKNHNMFLNSELINEYYKEIDHYNETKLFGPLLSSLVDNTADIDVAIAQFKIKEQTYKKFLIQTEVVYNKWTRKIKESNDPVDVLKQAQSSIGVLFKK